MKTGWKIVLGIIGFFVLLLGGRFLYEEITYDSKYTEAHALFEQGKYNEAKEIYNDVLANAFFYSTYSAYSGLEAIEKITPLTKKLATIDDLLSKQQYKQADSLLRQADLAANGMYYPEPKTFKKQLAEKKLAYTKLVVEKAQKAEDTNDFSQAISFYQLAALHSADQEKINQQIKNLRKKAFLQEYEAQNWSKAITHLHYLDEEKAKAIITIPDLEFTPKTDHTRIEYVKSYEPIAVSSYENGNMQLVTNLVQELTKIDSTSQYAPQAKQELEKIDSDVAYVMAKNEYAQDNLDEALHFYAQVKPASTHYNEAQTQLTHISSKLETEHNRNSLAKKRSEAYKEIKTQLNPYLLGKDSYSVVLNDAQTNQLKYIIISEQNGKFDSKTTDLMSVSDSTFDYFQDDVGMEILSHKATQVTPAGYNHYVGNAEYGRWRNDDEGSFWEFYGKYVLLNSMFNSRRIYQDDYYTYNRYYRTSSRPYYGSVYVPIKSAVKETPRFVQTVDNRAQKSWFYAKSAPIRSNSSKKLASTSSKSWYYGKKPVSRSSYTTASKSSNRNAYSRSSYASSSSSRSSRSSSSSGYKSSSSSSSSSGYRSSSSRSSSSKGYSSSSSSSRTSRSSSSSSRSRSSSKGGK